jgi:hypothetical protein
VEVGKALKGLVIPIAFTLKCISKKNSVTAREVLLIEFSAILFDKNMALLFGLLA